MPGDHRKRLGLQGKVVFFYGGNIGIAQDMDNIVRLAVNLQNEPDAYFLLVGEGSEVPRLRAEIAIQRIEEYCHPSRGGAAGIPFDAIRI